MTRGPTTRIRHLRRRMKWLEKEIGAGPKSGMSFIKAEHGALEWAIEQLEPDRFIYDEVELLRKVAEELQKARTGVTEMWFPRPIVEALAELNQYQEKRNEWRTKNSVGPPQPTT